LDLTGGFISTTKALVDTEGRIIAVLVALPSDPTWKDVADGMEAAFREAQPAMSSSSSEEDKRGNFTKINAGYSFGGGQQVSGCET
jgi:hypothetical protein